MSVKQRSTEELLSCILTDICMLRDEEWQPDLDSCEASIEVILEIAERLNLKPVDTRKTI